MNKVAKQWPERVRQLHSKPRASRESVEAKMPSMNPNYEMNK
jgi:hypothetical protein